MHLLFLYQKQLGVLLIIYAAMWGPLAHAQNYSNIVSVCNKGNVDLTFVKYSTDSGRFFTGENGIVEGWFTIKPGKCPDVNYGRHDTVALGFLQTNDQGITGNPVYLSSSASKSGRYKWAPEIICVPIGEKIYYKSGIGAVRDKFLPPCSKGHAEVRMSFGVKPNDGYPEITLRPRRNNALVPWIDTKDGVVPAPAEKKVFESPKPKIRTDAEIDALYSSLTDRHQRIFSTLLGAAECGIMKEERKKYVRLIYDIRMEYAIIAEKPKHRENEKHLTSIVLRDLNFLQEEIKSQNCQ